MPTAPRLFTVEEVEALIPELSRRVGAQLSLGAKIEDLARELSAVAGDLPAALEERESDTPKVRTLRRTLRSQVEKYQAGWGAIEGLGAVIKDVGLGLLDFYGRLDGRLVWLCWRYGEDRLGYYHELDAGFSGRRSLDERARTHLLN